MKSKAIFYLFLIFLFIKANIFAYDSDYIHPTINKNAVIQAKQLNLALRNIGFESGHDTYLNGKKTFLWFSEGGTKEDSPIYRANNHFHDPLKPWSSAGLKDSLLGRSSIVWAQDQKLMSLVAGGNWSWPKAREYYYNALTKPKKDEREVFFAQTFRALGQLMHLIADSSVPAHVRNDIHVFPIAIPGTGIEVGGQTYESWARTKWDKLTYFHIAVDQSIFNHAIFNSLAPVPVSALWDVDGYMGTNPEITKESIIGLAEYTNANFFSEDTIFKDYPHPAHENTNFSSFDLLPITVITTPGDINHNTFYIRGYGKQHLAGLKYFSKEITDSLNERYELGFMLDNRCYEEYAKYLIPRAVGYSAGLLNYFFRGDFKLDYETSGTPGYVLINNTGEKMEGDFTVYYDNDTINEERFPVWTGRGILEATMGDKTNTFDFIPPSDAKEHGKYVIVFRGKMGNEDGAVAGYVFRRILEITPPGQFVYSMIPGNSNPREFTQLKAKIRNASSEEIRNGALYAIAKYKTSTTQTDFTYSVSSPRPVSSLGSDTAAEFTFDFTDNPVPVSISDLYLQVIFRGSIGDENNAVAIGLKDISEPTPVDLFNNMDRVCIHNTWFIAGSPDAIKQADKNDDGIAEDGDVYSHDMKDIHIKFSPPGTAVYASPDDYSYYVSSLSAGSFKRVVYILADCKFNYSFYNKWRPPDTANTKDPFTHLDDVSLYSGSAVKNQTEIISDDSVYSYPVYYNFRGIDMWWGSGLIYENPSYPDDAKCEWEALH